MGNAFGDTQPEWLDRHDERHEGKRKHNTRDDHEHGDQGLEFDDNTSINLRFAGQYHDAESGLHYNYFRYYDPSSGRYVTSDPIGLDGGLNTFGYVGGNPNNRIDPFGRSPEDVSNAWKWLEINYPELTKDVNYYTNPILNYTLYSGMAYGNSIVFREKYLTDCLSDQQVEELKDTLIHELLHLHLSKQLGGDFNYMASDIYSGGEYHDWVYQKSAEILQYWQGTVPANSARPSINTYPK